MTKKGKSERRQAGSNAKTLGYEIRGRNSVRPRVHRHDCVAKGPATFDVSRKLISMGRHDFVLEKIGRYERPSKLLLNCIMPSGFRARSHPASLWLFNLLKCH